MGTSCKGFVIRTLEKRLTKKDKQGKQESVTEVIERRGRNYTIKPPKKPVTTATPKGKIPAVYIPYGTKKNKQLKVV